MGYRILNVLKLCLIVYFITVRIIYYHLGLGGGRTDRPRNKQINRQTDISTYRLNQPTGQFSENSPGITEDVLLKVS